MNIPRSIYVVDDDTGVRATLASIFRPRGCAVRCFASAREFLETAATLPPGCLILDVRLPDMDGLALQRRVVDRHLPFAMVVITGFGDVPVAVRAMKAGAADFVEKPFSTDAILAAVDAAADRLERGSAVPEVATAGSAGPLARLSMRERQVLDGLLAGWPNKTIALRLGLSPRTVETHRARLMDKMQANSLSQLVRFALAAGAGANTPARRAHAAPPHQVVFLSSPPDDG